VIRRHPVFASLTLFLCLCWISPPVAAEIAAGHLDDFEQGSTSGWQHGQQNEHEPRIIADGGPEGTGDALLRVSSSGTSGPGSKLVMYNEQDAWLGDYVQAGITTLEADLNNVGMTPLTMRFMFEGSGGNVLTDGFALPSNSGWQHATFSLTPEDLFSNGDILSTLGSVTKVWFLHNEEPSHPGPSDAGILFVDNLEAIGTPVLLAPGDFNGNGTVEQADLDLVLLHWGSPGEPRPAAWVNDLPDGHIDQDELDGVLLNWGNMAQQLTRASVPEPGALALLVVCATAMGLRTNSAVWRRTGFQPVR
jgi:hypothetical protein